MAEKPKPFRRQHATPRQQYQPPPSRESSSRRGYDKLWYRLQRQHLNREPVCRRCLEEGKVNDQDLCVDHITPFKGKSDPLRLDPANLQTLCRSHHSIKTNRDQA